MKRIMLSQILLVFVTSPALAQVSSENYVQTTLRISDTQVLITTQYYDGLGRPFEKVEQGVTPSGDNLIHYYIYDYRGNFAAGGWEHTYSSYTYAGSPQQTKHVHTTNGKQDVVEEYDYAYDHVGRLVKTTYCVNGSDKRELSVVDYDNYGRILLENIMGKDEVLYDYNAQNMLTDLGYNEGDRLNDWQGNYDESLSYDKMGNVQSLLRSGLLDDGSYGLIDNLSYSYHGNQLLKVDDATVGPYYQGAFHFVDGADEAVEYEYDANGNMVRDLNKGIISISYDLNNQPRKIEYSDGRNASYVYDAEGNKLSVSYNLTAMSSAQPQMPVMQSSDVASANVSNGQKTIDYCGNIIYDGDETMILNDVGYALYNKDSNLSFHYYLKDHLGNNRVVVSEDGEIEQVNDYYPTGALMASSKGGDTQCFKFNGKELDRTNGLNWYDYGARNYDAAIVRWDGMDKLCEKYYPFTPYGYCKNNFVNAIDLDGNRIVVWYKDDKGKDKSFVFTGKKIKIPDNQFVRDFVQAYNYNVGNGGGKAMQFAAKADYDYHIEDATNQEEVVTIYHNGGRNDKVIFWESRKGLLLSNGGRQSAATRLEHEFDHYVDDVKNHKAHSDRQNVYKTSYKNMEEYRVISGNEAFTAKRNGEGVRHNHYGKTYKTKSSTSIY